MDSRRANSLRGFGDVINEMARMRELGRTGYDPGRHEAQQGGYAAASSSWIPTADIFARGKDLVLRVSLAGIADEAINISLSGSTLTVSGRRGGEPDDEEVSFYAREIFYGAFERSVSLPEGVGEDQVEATFEEGLLEITVRDAFAVAPATEPKRIAIKRKPDGEA